MEQDAAAGNIPTPAALSELEGYAVFLRQEIAGIQGEIDNLVESLMKPTLTAPMKQEMARLQEELTEVEGELEIGKVRADELSWVLGVLLETGATPEISTDSIDLALEKVRRLSAELGGLRNGIANVPGPAGIDGGRAGGGDVRARGTYLVGEEGAELVKFGQKKGFVHNARATMRAMCGATARLASGSGFPVIENALPGLDALVQQGEGLCGLPRLAPRRVVRPRARV